LGSFRNRAVSYFHRDAEGSPGAPMPVLLAAPMRRPARP
jgi:hypothetical protein